VAWAKTLFNNLQPIGVGADGGRCLRLGFAFSGNPKETEGDWEGGLFAVGSTSTVGAHTKRKCGLGLEKSGSSLRRGFDCRKTVGGNVIRMSLLCNQDRTEEFDPGSD
jgi:hypothetical protein